MKIMTEQLMKTHVGRLAGAIALSLLAWQPASAQVGKSVTIVDANIATEQQLSAIPQLTPVLVKGIMDRRPFPSITELDAFLGQTLSPEQRTAVYGRLFVHLNLNTATREQILLIPNAGPRMVREFLEYRPYKALAQFHREIGKYVNDEELARLEQYVFSPIDLNTASDADIQTIPGVGARMLREFKEYRPYKAMEQFRREIGKYVDQKEVARMERYVVIN
jgi:DNA uptake protein ComE-like DNA-binding protein